MTMKRKKKAHGSYAGTDPRPDVCPDYRNSCANVRNSCAFAHTYPCSDARPDASSNSQPHVESDSSPSRAHPRSYAGADPSPDA